MVDDSFHRISHALVQVVQVWSLQVVLSWPWCTLAVLRARKREGEASADNKGAVHWLSEPSLRHCLPGKLSDIGLPVPETSSGRRRERSHPLLKFAAYLVQSALLELKGTQSAQ